MKKKIGRMAADVYAMEAMTVITASLIDRGLEDYMMETAMLKVFTTERLWEAVNDTFQIHGGSAYFNDSPLGRMLRDARINQIGEGSNEVLTSFIALVGMRGPGMEFKEILDTMLKPWRRDRMKAWGAGLNRLGAAVKVPSVPVKSERLRGYCRTARAFDLEIQSRGQPRAHSIPRTDPRHAARAGTNRQFRHGDVCLRLRLEPARFGAAGVGQNGGSTPGNQRAAELFLRQSFARIRRFLGDLNGNDDKELLATADAVLGREPKAGLNGR